MLRRKVDQPEEPVDAKEADESPIPAEGEPDTSATPEQPEASAQPDSPQPEPELEPAPEPGPVAHHSTEPQTLAEHLTARQKATHESGPDAEPPSKVFVDQKTLMKERREASKRQRVADKQKRKADRKAAKEARKAKRSGKTEALDLDPLSPTSPGPTGPRTDQPTGAGPAEVKSGQSKPVNPPRSASVPSESKLDLPPISPPGRVAGRPARRTAALIGGIDLGGTKIAAAVLDENHKVVAYRRRPTPDRGGPADVVRAMAVAMQEAAVDAGTEAHRLLAVGVGSPGSVNPDTGAVSGAGNLPDWDGTFQLRMALQEELGTEVRVGNDVQVGTRGEFELGAGAGYSSLLGVFWGTGVGGGIIINGEPWLGRGRAGEIGHTLVRRGGAKGLNGLNGTVEAYAGRKAMEEKARREVRKGRKTKLFKLMKKHEKPHLTSSIWYKAMREEDELALDLLHRASSALSAGIASAINLLDPEAVVIGGGLGVRFADTLVPEIIDGMEPYLLNKDNPPAVKVAALGDEGGVIGASLLVKDAFTKNQAPKA